MGQVVRPNIFHTYPGISRNKYNGTCMRNLYFISEHHFSSSTLNKNQLVGMRVTMGWNFVAWIQDHRCRFVSTLRLFRWNWARSEKPTKCNRWNSNRQEDMMSHKHLTMVSS